MEEKLKNMVDSNILADYIIKKLDLPRPDIKTYSPLTLAYIGDTVFDLIVKTMMVAKGNAPVNDLHKKTSEIVNASNQAEIYFAIKDKLNEEELYIFKRGRNAKHTTIAKNASFSEYKIATGIEALLGYLYLTNQFDRIIELVSPEICR